MDQPELRAPDAAASDPTFVGRGIAFPMRVDATGSIAFSGGTFDELDRAITMVLSTAPGERVMRPEFGCAIWDLLFEPVNPNTVGAMEQAVREALRQWEPRVEVEQVDAAPDDEHHELVTITVVYRVRTTNERHNLVYPFYVIPREEGS
jgi:phage baseplate assembly protein W